MADFSAFVGASYKSQSPVSDQEELINFYVEATGSPGATAQAVLHPTPGFELFATVPVPAGAPFSTGGRAMFYGITTTDPFPAQVGRCFSVFGSSFDEILATGAVIHRGIVAADENPATITTNGYG